jgi:23S rRNA (pseudouridine1915-N3)-methyltransferase
VKVLVVAVGRVRGTLEAPVAEYEERARRYWKLEVAEVEAGAPGRDPAPERVKGAEAERILARVPQGFTVVALTRTGKGLGSREFAAVLEAEGVRSSPGVAFIVGGAFGLSAEVLERAQRRVSLSPLTMPHEMARLVLAEQLYRAGTLLRGEPYHKGA